MLHQKNRVSLLLSIIVALTGSLLFGSLASAQAVPTSMDWDRNAEADQVAFYEAYVCSTSPTCSPLAGGIRLGANVPQPPIQSPTVALPQRVGMPWPTNAPLLGRVSVVAVDGVGNKSLESNIVVFRSQPLNAPKGLLVK